MSTSESIDSQEDGCASSAGAAPQTPFLGGCAPQTPASQGAAPPSSGGEESSDDEADEPRAMSVEAVEKKKKKPKVKNFRAWVAVMQKPSEIMQDPDQFWDEFQHKVKRIKFAGWAYEQGEEGNLHLQIYYETSVGITASAMFKQIKGWLHWMQPSYKPEAAYEYAIKADKTLVAGPWTRGERVGQGKRQDLKEAWAAIMQRGETYDSMMRSGQHLNVCANQKQWIFSLIALKTEYKEPVAYPLELTVPSRWKDRDETYIMNAPAKSYKQRHWWLYGEASTGKTYMLDKLLGKMNAFYAKGENPTALEAYAGQDLLWFDDASLDRQTLISLCDHTTRAFTISARYCNIWLKEDSIRNIIVSCNYNIDEHPHLKGDRKAIHERFTEIHCSKVFRHTETQLVLYKTKQQQ